MNQNKTALLTALLITMLACVSNGVAKACEINLTLPDTQKTTFEKGDTVVLSVRVMLTHNNCPVGLQDTKIQGAGLEIISATKWKNTKGNAWERKVKAVITAEEKEEVKLTARRTCDRDGGSGTLTMRAKTIK